jgi:hypothetical protein
MEAPKNPIELAIRHAVTAGALWKGARDYPEARRGLEKAARHHDAKAATFADEICAQAGIEPSTWARP